MAAIQELMINVSSSSEVVRPQIKTVIFKESQVWTPPSGVTWVYVEIVGGGGAGGASPTGSPCLGGGGGSGYKYEGYVPVSGPTTVIIGAGGGSVGGQSSFGLYAAKGGESASGAAGGMGGVNGMSAEEGGHGASNNTLGLKGGKVATAVGAGGSADANSGAGGGGGKSTSGSSRGGGAGGSGYVKIVYLE